MEPTPGNVAKEFTTIYYQSFGSDRTSIVQYYHDKAHAVFNQYKCNGREEISDALVNKLSFKTLEFSISDFEVLPVIAAAVQTIMIAVQGQCKVDGDDKPLVFSQTILLTHDLTDNRWCITNDVFKLSLHD